MMNILLLWASLTSLEHTCREWIQTSNLAVAETYVILPDSCGTVR